MKDAMKTRTIKNIKMLKPGSCLPPLLKFWLRAWLPLLVFTKILWFAFDLIYVILWILVVVHFISELTKFEMITTIFGHDYIFSSQTLRINVS